jgi:23S rRNA (adenine2503-C2)-methyltransferase
MVDASPTLPAGSPRQGFFDYTLESLTEQLKLWNQPAYRAKQAMEWVYEHGAVVHADMTSLPKSLRVALSAEAPIYRSEIHRREESSDGSIKLLLAWPDGATSECVYLPDDGRRTGCISSQVGCPVGCEFCASGIGGLQRQLTPGEIVEQAMRLRQLCPPGERLSNIVFMGMGEPLANYAATLQALRTINATWGMHIAARKITVSTVGLPSQMRRLAEEGLQITLAISLHAPNDELRRQIIPWAELVSIDELVEAGRYYFDQTGREVTIEYILLSEVNDRRAHAVELAEVARRLRSNVNLILYNPVSGLPFDRPSENAVQRFLSELRGRGVNTHVRRSRGLDVDAACGQLRRAQAQLQPQPSPKLRTTTTTLTIDGAPS